MHARSKILPYRMWHDSAIFIPKMTHITLSSDNKVNLLKPFCRWVWRFFYSGHRNAWTVHSLVTLLYISAVETCLTCLFRQIRHKRITVTRQNRSKPELWGASHVTPWWVLNCRRTLKSPSISRKGWVPVTVFFFSDSPPHYPTTDLWNVHHRIRCFKSLKSTRYPVSIEIISLTLLVKKMNGRYTDSN